MAMEIGLRPRNSVKMPAHTDQEGLWAQEDQKGQDLKAPWLIFVIFPEI